MNNAKSPNSEFVGKRLENMRWKRGLTKKGLAEIADIDQAKQILKMIDMFEDLDDVQNVYTNVEFTDEVLAQLDA